MKKWMVGARGPELVEFLSDDGVNADVRGGGHSVSVPASGVYESEHEARRAWFAARADKAEADAAGHERTVSEALSKMAALLEDVAWNRGQAAELRSQARVFRDSSEVVS